MGALTKAAIVTRALEVVGIPRLQARGELWADLLLNHLAQTARFPELATTHSAAIGDGTETIAYPTDYGFLLRDATKGHVGVFTDSGGTKGNVWLYDGAEVQASTQRTTDGKGTPSGVADDRANSRWLLHPISNIAGTLLLNYQKVPAAVAAESAVWWPDDLALMEAIIAIAERHQRGRLVQVQQAISEQARAMVMRSPGRAQMWTTGGVGANLDPRFFRK
jgi:hypothetical protein